MNIKPVNIQENINLSSHTTFRIGGPARYFVAVKNKDELVAVVKYAKANSFPYFILGGGSNILFADQGYEGLVIKMENEEMVFSSKESELKANCGAGAPLAEILFEATNRGWGGLEWALGIPGTLGGAVCGNAGRLGQDLAQAVVSVRILDADLREKEILARECQFSYRDSRFKHNQEIILGATLEFIKQDKNKAEEFLREAQKVIDKMPDFPSAGSVFKNYLVREEDELIKNYPAVQDKIRGGKLPAGFLIQQCGLAGRKIGGAEIWPNHANFILNMDKAKANDVLQLIELCKKSVAEKFGVKLEEEIRKVGF
ncbi:MAG: UDP-N-acetylmuramate dehydrogenase [Patescibacteria group bacterium]